MARKTKQGIDYFPHSCNYDDELKYIIALHGSEGYMVYFELLRKIYSDFGYYMNADKKVIALFSNEINVSIEKINVIINDCLGEHLFNKSIHKKYNILTSKGIQERYFEAIKRRKEIDLVKEYILIINVDNLLINVDINYLNVDKSTQSKVKYSKVKESKEEKYIFDFKKSLLELGIEKQIVEDWLKVRSKKKATNTLTAFNKIKKEINKCELSPTECIKIAVEKNWSGFEAKWIKNIESNINNLSNKEFLKDLKL